MIRIGKSQIRFIKRPIRPIVTVGLANTIFDSDIFEVEGEVAIHGDHGEQVKGWRVGFAQILVKDIDRASYKGLTSKQGAVNVERDRSKLRLHDLCRDSKVDHDAFDFPANYVAKGNYLPRHPLNVDISNTSLPATVKVSHVDAPTNSFPLTWTNSRTNEVDILQGVIINFRFCVIFMVGRPDGSFQQLQHFYWNMDWDVDFDVAPASGLTGSPRLTSRDPKQMGMTFGPVMAGPVPDSRFAAVLAAPVLPTCNQVLRLEVFHPRLKEVRP